ncbi:MAG TPA: hypothetical protein VNM92_07995 [Thermoanaerobaculia bacterium]|nr:hypothetical protein [Thermoanaerobaculia bacterium]
MPDEDGIPTAADVVAHLNRRLTDRGVTRRVDAIALLPYVNPMWMANWELPDLESWEDHQIVEEELREARWLFPHVL